MELSAHSESTAQFRGRQQVELKVELGMEKVAAAAAKSLQSCPTLCDPTDCSLPGSSIPGIFQARVLEWVAISFSRRSS